MYLAAVNRPIGTSNITIVQLKQEIKQVHARLAKLEADKYDLEKRNEGLDYDVRINNFITMTSA